MAKATSVIYVVQHFGNFNMTELPATQQFFLLDWYFNSVFCKKCFPIKCTRVVFLEFFDPYHINKCYFINFV